MMTTATALRIVVVIAGVMGACGVALAASSAHLPDATRLASASSMLLFHASAAPLAALLAARGSLQRHLGWSAACGFIAGTALFASELTLRQFAGHGLFYMAAPTGGTLLMASWLTLALAALMPSRAA